MILYYTATLALGIRTAHALGERTRERERWLARPRLPYPREKSPMGDAPYIGLKLGSGRTFA